MICNRADLDAAIDWLDREGYQRSAGFTGDTEVRQYRGHYLWRRQLACWQMPDTPYNLEGLSYCQVAPWVVDESW